MYGHHGAYLRYDLSTGCAERIAIPSDVLRRYVGGVGLGAWLQMREAPPGVDPRAPAAPIVFAFSPLVGSAFTTSAKFAIVAKSPLTGLISDSLSGSHFAIEGKGEGVDAIVLTGRCHEPSELVGGVLRPTRCWGRSAADTERLLSGEGRVAAIGVAGENGVRYASISNDGRHAGRGGLGAVMGAKNLKAIVVRGARPTPVADPARVLALARALSERSLGRATARYRELGTAAKLAEVNRLAALPTRNFQSGSFDAIDRLTPAALAASGPAVRRGCASCTIGCERIYKLGDGGVARVEYESLFALGPMCGIADAEGVLAATRRCDDYGLDTISAGGTIAFAMECGERGLIEGAPRFGDVEGVLALLDDIAHRRGLGTLLAEGSRIAARRIGGGSIAFAPQVKGLEMPGYEPRALQSLALGFAVGARGADHNRSGAYDVDTSGAVDRLHGDARTAALAADAEDRAALIDSLILCKFLRGAITDLHAEAAEILASVTGWDVTSDELRATARRIVTLRKAYNVREGWRPEDDTLPDRLLDESIPGTEGAVATLPRERLAEMVRAYYRSRGWSERGQIDPESLRDLGLEPGVASWRGGTACSS